MVVIAVYLFACPVISSYLIEDRGLEVVKQSRMNIHRKHIALSILTADNVQAFTPRMQNELEDAGRSSSEAVIGKQATSQHCLKRSKVNTPNGEIGQQSLST
jgi:hydrogenase maturation factor